MSEAERWQLRVYPPVLLPGKTAAVSPTFAPERHIEARGVSALLRCVERASPQPMTTLS